MCERAVISDMLPDVDHSNQKSHFNDAVRTGGRTQNSSESTTTHLSPSRLDSRRRSDSDRDWLERVSPGPGPRRTRSRTSSTAAFLRGTNPSLTRSWEATGISAPARPCTVPKTWEAQEPHGACVEQTHLSPPYQVGARIEDLQVISSQRCLVRTARRRRSAWLAPAAPGTSRRSHPLERSPCFLFPRNAPESPTTRHSILLRPRVAANPNHAV